MTKPVDIQLDDRFGIAQLTVTPTPNGVDFEAIMASGTVVNMLEQRPDQGGPSTVDDLQVLVVWLGKDSAVIRLTSV